MIKIWLVLRKELKEIIQQRPLLYSLFVLPFIIVILSGVVLNRSAAGQAESATIEQTQIQIGSIFRLYLLAECLITPAMIAAYSIVGEKNNRTLEPLLATPVDTWQLLLAKSLSAMLPAIAATWIAGGIFIVEIAIFTSPAVFAQVVTPGWLILLLLTAPALTLTPVALAVMTSSRFNDPRSAAQISSLIFVVLVLIFSTVGRSLVISPVISILVTIVLVILGAILLWSATLIFQRENILTQWK
jgi:ABC-2 type transport system permease protein